MSSTPPHSTYHFPIRRGRGWYTLIGQNFVLPSLGTNHFHIRGANGCHSLFVQNVVLPSLGTNRFPIRGAKGFHSLFGQNVVLPSLGTNNFIMKGEKEMAFRVLREFCFRLLVDEWLFILQNFQTTQMGKRGILRHYILFYKTGYLLVLRCTLVLMY